MAKGRRGDGSRSGKQDPYREAVVLLPLNYNDGARIPDDSIEDICDEVYAAFAGWTIEGSVKGAYRMESGERKVEKLVKLSIILKESQLPDLERMVGRWAGRLGQEAMLLKVSSFSARFIPPQPEED